MPRETLRTNRRDMVGEFALSVNVVIDFRELDYNLLNSHTLQHVVYKVIKPWFYVKIKLF